MCVCLDFLKPKMRINKKVDKKMLLAEPKTQLFENSCVLGSGKIQVQNTHNLWTFEVHISKRAASVLSLLPLDACYYENAPKYIISSLTPSPPSHLSALHSARPHPHASHLCALLCPLCGKSLCSVIRLSFFLFFFFLSSSSSMRF